MGWTVIVSLSLISIDFIKRQQQKDQADIRLKQQKLELEQQKLASQLIKEEDAKESQKEKLATQILQQGLRKNGNA